jgi:hypothetical protein
MNWISNIKLYSETPQSDRLKVFAYGKTKVGKTYLGSTFPLPFIIDTDGSLSGLKKKDLPFVSITRDQVLSRKVNVYETVNQVIMALRDKKPPFDKMKVETLMIDGLTMLADLMLVELMLSSAVGKESRNPLVKKATFDEYGALGQRLSTLFTKIDDLDVNIYCTAGEKLDKCEATGAIIGSPDIVGSFRNSVGHRFDAVLHMAKENGKYTCFTTSHGRYDAGIRGIDNVPDKIIDPSYEKIFKKG